MYGSNAGCVPASLASITTISPWPPSIWTSHRARDRGSAGGENQENSRGHRGATPLSRLEVSDSSHSRRGGGESEAHRSSFFFLLRFFSYCLLHCRIGDESSCLSPVGTCIACRGQKPLALPATAAACEFASPGACSCTCQQHTCCTMLAPSSINHYFFPPLQTNSPPFLFGLVTLVSFCSLVASYISPVDGNKFASGAVAGCSDWRARASETQADFPGKRVCIMLPERPKTLQGRKSISRANIVRSSQPNVVPLSLPALL